MDLSICKMESTLGPSSADQQEEMKPDDTDLRPSAVTSHTEAVQALRRYLLRKMSSEDSTGEKELDGNGTTGKVISMAEADGSKLYCSLVQRPAEADHQGNKRCLTKHMSLDLDDSTHVPPAAATATAAERYLRTDLCVPVLWSKCSFCDDFFEDEEHLRKHLRDSHFQYFLNYVQLRPLTSTKSLSDLPFSSALQISDSPAKSDSSDGTNQGTKNGGSQKKPVKCQVCQKSFTTKWNCKQHLKCHAKESITPPVTVMETDCVQSDASSSSAY